MTATATATATAASREILGVLVVEDSPTQAQLLRHLLTKHGYSVTVARNGVEGLAGAKAERPSLIISDILMPVMDGFTMCTEIKRNETLRHIPVVLLTALSDPADVLRGLKCGADNFVVKPFQEDQLIACIEEMIAAWQAGEGSNQPDETVFTVAGERHIIAAEPERLLRLLLSVYGNSVRQNKQLEQAQQDLLRRTTALTEAQRIAQLGSWEWDVKQNRMSCSAQFHRVLGVPAEYSDAGIESLYAIAHPVGRELLKQSIAQALGERQCCESEFRVVRPDGADCVVHLRAKTLFDGSGQPLQMLGTVQDITERKLAEREILELNQTLERRVTERTAELEAFAYSVSHDLRGPLRAIDGFCAMLEEECAQSLSPDGSRFLKVARENAALMGRLINGILELSRLGRRELEKVQIDMTELVERVIQSLSQQQPGNDLAVTVGNLPPAVGDPLMIGQVWTNLLSNAIKFSGGVHQPSIEISGCVEGDAVMYSVKDNGIGFDEQYAAKLFRVFHRLHGAADYPGTGVGLSIVKRIVERHGGRVWAHGAVGEGATFQFNLESDAGARPCRPATGKDPV